MRGLILLKNISLILNDKTRYRTVNSRYRGERTGLSVNGTLAAVASSDYGAQYFSTDLLGSVKTTTDSLGTQKASYTYDAFGTLVEGDLTGTTDFGYLGKQHDPTANLYNYGYRDYSPSHARFTTVDPIRDGTNWFSYCNGDPVNFVDLWGYNPIVAVGAGVIIIGAVVVTTVVVITVTQSTPYKEAVKEVASRATKAHDNFKKKANEIKDKAKETITNALSKGKKEIRKEVQYHWISNPQVH